MAFQLSAHGPRAGVLKKIQAAKAKEPKDEVQVEALKVFLTTEVNAIPTEFNGARVDANCDSHAGGRMTQSTVIPLKLDLE